MSATVAAPPTGRYLATLSLAALAVVSGAFSLTMQAVQLGFSPRIRIAHTSTREYGQIYIAGVNWALMIGCVLVILGFRTSSNLAAAYGVAVTSTMVITTLLWFVVARERWRWTAFTAGALAMVFLAVDFAFFGANIIKVTHGGWLPLAMAAVIYALMTTWKQGRRILGERIQAEARPLNEYVADLLRQPIARVPGTAIFMSGSSWRTPPALRQNLQHNKVLHERVVFVTVTTRPVPHVPADERLEIEEMGGGLARAEVSYGFMEEPDIPRALAGAADRIFVGRPDEATYFLGRESIVAGRGPGMARWRDRLFALMSRNATTATAYFGIPPRQVVELGAQVEI